MTLTADRPDARPVPVTRRGPHDRVRALLGCAGAAVLLVAAVAVLVGSQVPLLAAPVLAAGAAALLLRRRSFLVGPQLHVRGLRTRTLDLREAQTATLTTQRSGDALLVVLAVDDGRQRLAAPVWRTRSPRGVDPFACDALADRLVSSPAAAVVPLLRAQGRAVRTGVRPTPLDVLVQRTAASDRAPARGPLTAG